jgi:hypothetical protein
MPCLPETVLQDLDIDNVVNDIKERFCYVALDFDAEMLKWKRTRDFEIRYQLPDGQVNCSMNFQRNNLKKTSVAQ